MMIQIQNIRQYLPWWERVWMICGLQMIGLSVLGFTKYQASWKRLVVHGVASSSMKTSCENAGDLLKTMLEQRQTRTLYPDAVWNSSHACRRNPSKISRKNGQAWKEHVWLSPRVITCLSMIWKAWCISCYTKWVIGVTTLTRATVDSNRYLTFPVIGIFITNQVQGLSERDKPVIRRIEIPQEARKESRFHEMGPWKYPGELRKEKVHLFLVSRSLHRFSLFSIFVAWVADS